MSLGSVKARNMDLDADYGDAHSSVWPSTVWMHLFVSDPTQGGIELLSVGGYAPVGVANTSANWPPAANGTKTNGAAITFPVSTGAWSGPADFWWLTDVQAGLGVPATPTVTPTGATGTTSWYYVITALNSEGETTASGVGVTNSGVATLSATDYNALSWAATSGAASYNVYQSTDNINFYLLANSTTNSYNDVGDAVGTQTPPTSNTTMTLLDGGPLSTPIIVPASGYTVEFAPGSIVIAA